MMHYDNIDCPEWWEKCWRSIFAIFDVNSKKTIFIGVSYLNSLTLIRDQFMLSDDSNNEYARMYVNEPEVNCTFVWLQPPLEVMLPDINWEAEMLIQQFQPTLNSDYKPNTNAIKNNIYPASVCNYDANRINNILRSSIQ